jgi:hypothetical protein
MAMKRGNGEGSVYMRGDGRWYGAITLGVNAQGRPNRKTVSGKTCTEVVKKLILIQRQVDDGLPVPDTALTSCLDQTLRPRLAPSAPAGEFFTYAHAAPRFRATRSTGPRVRGLWADLDCLQRH